MPRFASEADMSLPIQRWLRERDMEPYGEVPVGDSRFVDHVGVRWGSPPSVVLIESKLSMTREVIRQAMRDQLCGPSYVAVATMPAKASMKIAVRYGLGVLSIYPDHVDELSEPGEPDLRYIYWFDSLVSRLRLMERGGRGGLAGRHGDGPAQEVHRKILRFLKQKPDASWYQIFVGVPNHYKHPESMRSSMRFCEERTTVEPLPNWPAMRHNRIQANPRCNDD